MKLPRGTRVDVLSTVSGTVLGSVADTSGVHGIALAPDLKRGYKGRDEEKPPRKGRGT